MPENQPFKLRSLLFSVYIPTALFSIGEGAIIPILPAAAEQLGASLPVAGLIAGLLLAGVLLADLPAGVVVARLGERKAMIYSALFCAIGIFASFVAQNLFFLGLGALLVGFGHAVFGLARQVFIAGNIPYSHRARALSIIGGQFRVGAFAGPLLASAVVALFGIQSVFLAALILWALAAVVTSFSKDKETPYQPTSFKHTLSIAKRERKKILTIGGISMIVAMMRTARQIGLPLVAISIGIPAATSALLIGVAGAVELSLFFVSGAVMDKYGRRWAAIPTLVGMSISNLLFFFIADSSMFLTVAIIFAIANAFSAGLVLVLGADAAPEDARGEFLSTFRLLVDAGVTLSSPLLSVFIVITGALAPAMTVFSGLGVFGLWLVRKYLPRTKRA